MITTLERWHHLYPDHVSPELHVSHPTLNDAWAARVSMSPQEPAVRYFDTSYTANETETVVKAIAAGLQELGVRPGDPVGIQLQNVPQFPLMMLALWRIGAVALVLNPMYKLRELTTILSDAKPAGIIGVEGAIEAVYAGLGELAPSWMLTTPEYVVKGRKGRKPRALGDAVPGGSGPNDLGRLIHTHLGRSPSEVRVSPSDPALLTYTSGTTGPPKGAIGTHANLLSTARATQQWLDVQQGDRVLAIAPLFHITGAVAVATMSLLAGAELICIGRLEPELFLQAIVDYEVHHICGSITAFNALLELPEGGAEELNSLRTVFSGGAPVPPRTVERFAERFGHYIRNVYGMTETASACIAVPTTLRAPVDKRTGTLAIGIPMPGVRVRIRGSEGQIVAPGQLGELEICGPSVTREYLNKPKATSEALVLGWLRTGDVAFVDEAGWVYLVDRKKDQINVSGYKVWPREVEDVLYEHPAVREAAVIGRPHPYSGEEVVAYVSLQAGHQVSGPAIQAHVKARLATFKAPKEVFVVSDLPKTATGKIQRRALREL